MSGTLFIVLSIVLVTLLILFVTNIYGNLALKIMHLDDSFHPEPLGFAIWLSFLFIIDMIMIPYNPSSSQLFNTYLFLSLTLIIFGVKYFKITYSKKELVYLFLYVSIFVLISSRYTLGEELGDNTYLFNLVTRNVDATVLNNFDGWTGQIFDTAKISTYKESLSYYHFYSFVIHFLYKIPILASIPAYLFNYWISSLLLYFSFASILLSIIKFLKIKNLFLIISVLAFVGFYHGGYYFNLALSNFGITFLSVFVSILVFLFYIYWTHPSKRLLSLISFVYLSLFASGVTGLVDTTILLAGFVFVNILKHDSYLLFQFIFFPIGIMIYLNDVQNYISFDNIILIYLLFLVLGFILHRIKSWKYFNKFIIFSLGIIWLIIFKYVLSHSYNYEYYFKDFFLIKENYDRVIDYFSFYSFDKILTNTIHWILILAISLNKRYRSLFIALIFILIFYMNPFFYPYFFPYIKWLFNRSFFVAFNITTLSFGLISLFSYLKTFKRIEIKKNLYIGLTIITVLSVAYQLIYKYPEYYKPSSDFNALYKMDNQEVDILSNLNNIIEIEDYDNPRIISQIYSTNIFMDNIQQIYFTTPQRRNYIKYQEKNFSDNLYNVFYSPTLDGLTAPMEAADYSNVCTEVLNARIDFIVLRKDLFIYDEKSDNYIPLHWVVRDCYTYVYENNDYILYRIYR